MKSYLGGFYRSSVYQYGCWADSGDVLAHT